MSEQENREYYRYRERTERNAAQTAASEAARRAHQQLAQIYAERLKAEPAEV